MAWHGFLFCFLFFVVMCCYDLTVVWLSIDIPYEKGEMKFDNISGFEDRIITWSSHRLQIQRENGFLSPVSWSSITLISYEVSVF